MRAFATLALLGAALFAQSSAIKGGRSIEGAWDASAASTTKPMKVGTSDPGTCGVGEFLFRSDTGVTKACTATNTWNQVTGAAGVTYIPTRTSGTVLTLPAIAADTMAVASYNCGAISSGATFTLTSGTGTLWVALGSDCAVKVRHNVVGSCSSGCTEVGSASGFDAADLPLYQWGVTAGALDATGTAKLVSFRSQGIAAGTNVSFSTSNGVTTISAANGGGISTSATALPTSCTEGTYYDISLAAGRSLWRCRGTSNWVISFPGNGIYAVEDFLMGSGDPQINGDLYAGWNKSQGGVPSYTRGGTMPNVGLMDIATGALSGDQASINARYFGVSGVSSTALLGTFYFEATWKLSRATNVKLLIGFQDASVNFLQYNEFVGVRYEAAGSAGVYKYTVQNTSTAYASVAGSSTITADANYHTVRMWRVNSGTLYMSIDGESPVTVSTTAMPSTTVAPYLGVQSDTTSAVTMTYDRIVMWSGATAR